MTEGIQGGGKLPDYNTAVENSVVSTFKTLKSQGMTDDEAIKFMESTLSASELNILRSLGDELPTQPGKPVLRKALAHLLMEANKDIQLGKNPWLNPAFMTAFGDVMMDIMRIKSQARFLEAKASMTNMLMQLHTQLDAAKMTRAAANAEAAMRTTEATFAFVQAGISAAGGIASLGTRALATRNINGRERSLNSKLEKYEAKAEKKHQEKLDEVDRKQNALGRSPLPPVPGQPKSPQFIAYEQNRDKLIQERRELLGSSPLPKNDATGLPARSNNTEKYPQRDNTLKYLDEKEQKEYVQLHQEYSAIHDPQTRQGFINSEIQILDTARDSTFKTLGHIVDGSKSMQIAGLTISKGEYDAKGQELQAFAKVFEHLERNASQGMQSAASDMDAILRAFDGILAANSRAHALGRN